VSSDATRRRELRRAAGSREKPEQTRSSTRGWRWFSSPT